MSRPPTMHPEIRPGWDGGTTAFLSRARILAMALVLLLFPTRFLAAALIVELDGVRLPVHLRGEQAFVPLAAYASARFLEHEYSLVEDIYAIRAPSPEGADRVLAFRPGVAEVLVDGRPRPLGAPPFEAGEGLLVPLHDLAALLLPPEALTHLSLRPQTGETAILEAWEARYRPGQTKLLVTWQGTPGHRLEPRPEAGIVEVVFDGARLGKAPPSLELGGELPGTVRLEENPKLLQVRLVVPVARPFQVTADGFFLGRTSQYVLDLRMASAGADPGDRELPSLDPEEIARLQTFRVALDPGHGGGDRGATGTGGAEEKQVVLQAARELADRLRASGIGVELSRSDDRPLPMRTRIHILNRARPDLVLSLHARSLAPGEVSTAPLLALLGPAPDRSTSPPLLAPSPGEREAAEHLASEIALSCQRSLGVPATLLRDPSLLPGHGVLAPTVVLDLGPVDSLAAPSDPGSQGPSPLERLVRVCHAGIVRYLLARARELVASGALPASPLTTPGATGQGSTGLDQAGYREDVLGSPENAPEEMGELPMGSSPGPDGEVR